VSSFVDLGAHGVRILRKTQREDCPACEDDPEGAPNKGDAKTQALEKEAAEEQEEETARRHSILASVLVGDWLHNFCDGVSGSVTSVLLRSSSNNDPLHVREKAVKHSRQPNYARKPKPLCQLRDGPSQHARRSLVSPLSRHLRRASHHMSSVSPRAPTVKREVSHPSIHRVLQPADAVPFV